MGLVVAALAASALAGSASASSSDIEASYASPVRCSGYTCPQLGLEAQALSQRAAVISGAQDQKRTNDQIATGVAKVVFWPAAFLAHGDGQTAAERANLNGQMVAVEQARIQKKRNTQFQGQRPPGT